MFHTPVIPHATHNLHGTPGEDVGAALAGIPGAFDDPEDVDLKDALMENPLIGVEQATSKEEELEALPARPMRSPPR